MRTSRISVCMCVSEGLRSAGGGCGAGREGGREGG
jgi:hypothetical protein